MDLTEDQVRQHLADIAGRRIQPAERAMEILYIQFSPALRNYLWKNFRQDESWIDDVIQDTFMDVWRHSDRFHGESKFSTWLIGVVRHKAMDALRRERSGHEPLEEFEETLMDAGAPPLELIDAEQRRSGVHFCLESLSASGKLSFEHREVLYLAYVEDLDQKEMAEVTGCSENLIKGRLFHARKRITNCLRRRLGLGDTHEHE